jgi:hypothetical protein
LYVRSLFVSPVVSEICFMRRPNKKSASDDQQQPKGKSKRRPWPAMKFPVCAKSVSVPGNGDVLYGAVMRGDDNVVYHAENQSHGLVDFAFKRGGVVYGIQVTIGATHSSAPDQIQAASRLLFSRGCKQFHLVFAVPSTRFIEFKTEPADPLAKLSVQEGTVEISVIEVHPPGSGASVVPDAASTAPDSSSQAAPPVAP